MTADHNPLSGTADILVVDDDSGSLSSLNEILCHAGYKLRGFEDPQSALEAALVQPPDLFLLDVEMPEMSGFEACASLKQDARTRDVPILFVGEFQDAKDKVRGFEAGCADFISKPFQKEEVLARVRTHLKLGSMQGVPTCFRGTIQDATESKLAEQSLRDSEHLARLLLNATSDLTTLVDKEGTILDLNNAMSAVLGGTREELIGASVYERLPQKSAETRRDILRQALQERKPVQYVDRPRPGTAFDVSIYPLEATAGGKDRAVIFVHDITEREQYEKKLQEREESLNEAQRITKLGSWFWNPASGEVKWSRNLYEMMGLNPEGPAPPLEDQASLYTPESWNELNRAVERTLKEGDPYDLEVTAIRTDGRYFFCHIRGEALRNSDGQIVMLQGTAQDITDRKKAENDLRESEEKFRRLVENVPDVLWTADETGKAVYVSDNVVEHFGYNQEEICEDPHIWLGSIHPEDADRVLREFSTLFETGKPLDIEYRLRHKDGHWVWLHDRSMSIYQKDGIKYADGLFSDISFRKQADQDLKKNRDYLEHIINSIPDAVLSVKLPERTIEWGRDSYNVLGYNMDEHIGKTDIQFYSTSDDYQVIVNMQEAAVRDNRDAFIAEVLMKKNTGEIFPAEISTTIFRDRDEVVSATALVRDISLRRKAQDALKNSEERLKDAQRIAQIGNWELDHRTDTLTWSDEMFRIFEIASKYFGANHQTFLEAVHPDDRWMVHKPYPQSLEKDRSQGIDYRLLLDGRIKFVHEHCETVYSPEGKPIRSLGTVQDITQRKEMEQALEEKEENLRSAHEIARLGYWEWDLVTDQLTWSDEMYRIHGIDPGTPVTSDDLSDRVHPDDLAYRRQQMDDLLDGKATPSFSYRIVRPDGSVRYIYGMKVLERDDHGNPSRIKGTVQDVTEMKTVEMAYRDSEELLRKAQAETMNLRLDMAHLNRVMTMNELAASFAHEINQPLGAIMNNASVAKSMNSQSSEKSEEMDEILDDIAGDAQLAGKIIRKIRGVMKKGDAVFAYMDVNLLLDEAIALYQNTFTLEHICVDVEKDPDLVSVKGDAIRLLQVLINLITNAVDAMSGSSEKALGFKTSQSGGMVIVSVSDTGTGVEKSKIDKIFEPFYTTKIEGMGIGLRLCRSIIEEHDGRIWVENNPGSGARFCFSLKAW